MASPKASLKDSGEIYVVVKAGTSPPRLQKNSTVSSGQSHQAEQNLRPDKASDWPKTSRSREAPGFRLLNAQTQKRILSGCRGACTFGARHRDAFHHERVRARCARQPGLFRQTPDHLAHCQMMMAETFTLRARLLSFLAARHGGFGLCSAVVLLALCFVPHIGMLVNGSRRWINLRVLRPFSQSPELGETQASADIPRTRWFSKKHPTNVAHFPQGLHCADGSAVGLF